MIACFFYNSLHFLDHFTKIKCRLRYAYYCLQCILAKGNWIVMSSIQHNLRALQRQKYCRQTTLNGSARSSIWTLSLFCFLFLFSKFRFTRSFFVVEKLLNYVHKETRQAHLKGPFFILRHTKNTVKKTTNVVFQYTKLVENDVWG